MNIYSKLALATAQSSALLATLGILGITPPAIAASLTFELSSRIYETDINGINGIEYPYLYSTRATITAASQQVPEPSGIGAFSLLTLGFFLKKKETSSRKAKAIAKV